MQRGEDPAAFAKQMGISMNEMMAMLQQPPRLPTYAEDEQQTYEPETIEVKLKCSKSRRLGPFGEELPHNLPQKLALLVRQDANPDMTSTPGLYSQEASFLEREIRERASECDRIQFLRQCITGNQERCKKIWASLDERDRRDLYRACQSGPLTLDRCFLDFMEPRCEASTDCSSSLGKWDDLSDAASTSPGTDSLSDVSGDAADYLSEASFAASSIASSTSSFASTAFRPRRRTVTRGIV